MELDSDYEIPESLALLASEWKNDAIVKSANEAARSMSSKISVEKIRAELLYYLYGLINDGGVNCVQPKRAEGPEDYPVLLVAAETSKRYKARIRAIGLEAGDYLHNTTKFLDLIRKSLMLKPAYKTLKNDQKVAMLQIVASDVYELKVDIEEILKMTSETNKEYGDYFTALSLEYNLVNAMSYHRNLYGTQPLSDIAPTKHR